MSDIALHRNTEGVYTVHYFDRYGRHLKELEEPAENYLSAVKQGEEGIDGINDQAVSFVVRRTLYNSLDHH